MSDYRNALAKARDEFFESEQGKRTLKGVAEGRYLKNRIELAFLAGAKAFEEKGKKAERMIKCNSLCSELIKLAAFILTDAPFPSIFPDDWSFPKSVPQYFKRALMGNANKLDDMKKDWAVQLRNIADKLRRISDNDEE